MAAGYDDTNFRRNALLRVVENVIVRSIFRNGELFPIVGPAQSPGGDRITWAIDYSSTDNGGFMSAYSDAFPDPDDMASVNAYQTKDYVQNTALTYDILENQVGTNYDGKTTDGFTSYQTRAIENAATNMLENLSGRYVTDLIALIDGAGNFSDAALTRSTYGLASYETAVGGALTEAAVGDMIEGLMSSTYGGATIDELVLLMSQNQLTNLSRLTTGVQYREFNASSDSTAPIDGSTRHRTVSYHGVPIFVDNAMSTTDILCLRRGTIEVFDHQAMGTKDIPVAAQQKRVGIFKGSNLVVKNPTWNGKLSGLTA
jgi:hypothetical protein